jgi:hypothetical protein
MSSHGLVWVQWFYWKEIESISKYQMSNSHVFIINIVVLWIVIVSVFGKVIGLMAGLRSPTVSPFLSSPQSADRLWGPSSGLVIAHQGLFPGSTRLLLEVDHSM